MTTGRAPFALDGPLPRGLTALEASAGTGKTYALSSLATRYVAEQGVPASGLLVVSFTEAATAELRGRVRGRLAGAARHLEAVLDGDVAAPSPSDSDEPDRDRVLDRLATGARPDLQLRLERLQTAVGEFDAATITTIHGFCRRVLAGTGTATGDLDIDDGGLDVEEVVGDLFLARFGHRPDAALRPDRVATAVRTWLSMPDARLYVPEPPARVRDSQAPHVTDADATVRLVEDARAEVIRRRTARRTRTFDGLLADTRELLRGPDGGAVVAALRDRLRVVLIDEFQDTDRVQWDIFRTAFVGAPDTAVVLVGDPKQSIYRFRSAEISAYLDAVAAADDQVGTLGTNWRSDAPLLAALETLFTSPERELFEFGSPAVAFTPVGAAPGRSHAALSGSGAAALTIRRIEPSADGVLTSPGARLGIRHDVVRVVTELLDGSVTIRDGDHERELCARDIAVLTRSNVDATALAVALGEAGHPAATSSSNSVLDSDAARQWRVLLRALEHPGSAGRVRAAALGWFLGRSAVEVDELDELGLDELHDLLREWSDELARRGVAALLTEVRRAGLHERLLAGVGGERQLTDVDHIAELLLTVTGGRGVGATTLLDRMADVTDGIGEFAVASELLARRIDRDDDAVQVLTVHKAKGLEFPIVLCPYLWSTPRSSGIPHAHDGECRWLDTTWLTGADARWAFVKPFRRLNSAEVDGEDRRLMYVALTRARHRAYVWWPAFPDAKATSPLAQLLMAATGSASPPVGPGALDALVARGDGVIDVVPAPAPRTGAAPPPARPAADARPARAPAADELAVAVARRRLDPTWRIWSFSAITARAADRADATAVDGWPDPAAGTPPVIGGTDEPALDALPVEPAGTLADPGGADASTVTGLRTAPGGTAFGTLVHDILEHCDFAAPDLDHHLLELCTARLRHRELRIAPSALAAGLADAVRAPLGGPLGQRRLRDITTADRLDELEFHLALGRLRADSIGAVLAEHLPPDDLLRPWAEGLAGHGFTLDVEGMLTGSIDLVLRADDRYHVADHKTNQLGHRHTYAPDTLVEAMEHHHYPLQAVLYLVALHRYLRWRVPGYDPTVQLGGAAYLFLRGMTPAHPADVVDTADVAGVFWWEPGAAAVVALDELLTGASGAAA